MAYVTSHPGSMAGYGLYHTPFNTATTESLQQKRSAVISEVELPLDDDVSTIPRTLPGSSELDQFVLDPEQNEDIIKDVNTDISLGYHLAQKDQLQLVQHQDQGQGQGEGVLALLASVNEQTTSLLASYSQLDPQNGQNGEEDTSLLEQAVVLGQIALVLASSLPTALTASGDPSAEWPLDTLQAQTQAKGENHTLGVQTQVVVALANMAMALVKQFDRTGDRRDLEEAGGLYGRVLVVGRGRELRVERGKTRGIGKGKRKWELGRQEDEGDGGGEEEDGDGDERGEVFVRLEKLEELLGERGFVV